MGISVKREMIVPAPGKAVGETRSRVYLEPEGVKLREFRSVISQSDTSDYTEYRDSPDNGRTWSEWIRKIKSH